MITKIKLPRRRRGSEKNHLITFALNIFFIFILTISCIQSKHFSAEAAAGSILVVGGEGQGVLGLDLKIGKMEWTRGCETRMGNLAADAYSWKTKADIGFANGGSIRHDRGIDLISKGTVFTSTQLNSFMPFSNKLMIINLNGYRLKQALEGSVNKILTNKTASELDDNDADGLQHGNCYGVIGDLQGSGRFLHVNSRLRMEVNPQNPPQVITGSATDNSLRVITEGKRITGIYFDGKIIYTNPLGDVASGWGIGNISCTVKGISYTNSQACSFFSTAVPDFYASGGDENPSFNPELLEIGNDGTAVIINSDAGVDKNSILEYIFQFTTYYPRISGRIIMP